jgi:hypothetical protein
MYQVGIVNTLIISPSKNMIKFEALALFPWEHTEAQSPGMDRPQPLMSTNGRFHQHLEANTGNHLIELIIRMTLLRTIRCVLLQVIKPWCTLLRTLLHQVGISVP